MAKVTDFGIAKSVSNSTITAFGTTLGSVHYFSPEHARGGFTDAKSDLYSLGVVLYEMVTGKVPFDADTPVSVALKHMQETPKEPINLNPAIPIAVNKIIMKAMKKDPNLRYSSATEMLKDLTLALKNPDGNFVAVSMSDGEFQTQVIPTLDNKGMEEKIKEEDRKKGKKQNFFKKHKSFTAILVLILLFALSLGGTSLVFNLTRNKDIQVPNLVGLSLNEAKEKLNRN
ncbi:MAG: protein kinase [Clostridia bacterium]|nr:protein kinase [Clostridia bacterium]